MGSESVIILMGEGLSVDFEFCKSNEIFAEPVVAKFYVPCPVSGWHLSLPKVCEANFGLEFIQIIIEKKGFSIKPALNYEINKPIRNNEYVLY